jgi:hypothetical protein
MEMVRKLLVKLAPRLREPSTYAGLASVSAALGLVFPEHIGQAIPIVGTAIGSLLAVFLPEAK